MQIKAIFFDLDGTLLPMDQEVFTKGYFHLLAGKLAPYGYQPQPLIDAIWSGTAAMVKNDGSRRNEEAFWQKFYSIFGEKSLQDKPLFEEFYRCEFRQAQSFCGYTPQAATVVQLAKELGFRTVLATNPIFPRDATEIRLGWAGLSPADFEWITTYENTSYCKPNPLYFRTLAEQLGLQPQECLMVGNDAAEDLAAIQAGMQVFLILDCLIDRTHADLSTCLTGSFPQLADHLRQLARQNAGEKNI